MIKSIVNTVSKHGVIPMAVIALLVFILGIFIQKSCTQSTQFKEIKAAVFNQVEDIKREINESKTREQTLIKGQKNLELALYGDRENEGLFTKINKSQKSIEELQRKLDQRPQPTNPDTFETLEKCRNEYQTLNDSYRLCLTLNQSKDDTMNLFGQVLENLLKQNSLLKGAVDELHNQADHLKKIENTVIKGMKDLDKAHRMRKSWKDVKKVSIGISAGALAVLILKAVLK